MKLGIVGVAVGMVMVLHGGGDARADFDVRPYLAGGRILTGGHDDATSEDLALSHAFGYGFGEDEASPFAITDPGFNAEAGDLTPGSVLTFQVESSLLYWNGAGAVDFAAAPAGADGVTLDLEKFVPPASVVDVTVTGGSGEQGGFAIGTVLADGHVHQHLTSLLTRADAGIPEGGVYAFSVSLILQGNEATRSDRFYLVYGNGVSDGVLDEAVVALNAQAVPEAGSLGVLGIGVMAMMWRRRRA